MLSPIFKKIAIELHTMGLVICICILLIIILLVFNFDWR